MWHNLFCRALLQKRPMFREPTNRSHLIVDSWPIHIFDVTHSHIWRDSFTYLTWLIYIFDVPHSHTWHDSCIRMFSNRSTIKIQNWCDSSQYDVTHPCIRPVTHSLTWHDSLIYIHIYVYQSRRDQNPQPPDARTYIISMWRDSFIYMKCLIIFMSVYSPLYLYIFMYIYTHLYIHIYIHMWRESFIYVKRLIHTGWRRLIGSPKLQIIFHKRAIKYKSLLRKTTYKDKGSYESSPPCICEATHSYMCDKKVMHMRDVTRVMHMHMYDLTCSYMWHDSFICLTWLMHMRDMTRSYLRRVSFVYVYTSRGEIRIRNHQAHVQLHLSYAKVGCLCDIWLTHTCVRGHVLLCATWLIRICATGLMCTLAPQLC